MSDASSSGRLRLVTYNVLSPPLCSKSWFPRCREANVQEATRYPRIEKMLLAQMEKGAIICLQEVDLLWYGKLSVFFAQHDYDVSFYHYKSSMGIGIAFPRPRFALQKLVAECVANYIGLPETPPAGYDPAKPLVSRQAFPQKTTAAAASYWSSLTTTFYWALEYAAGFVWTTPAQATAAIDEYQQIVEANHRSNVYLIACLRDKQTGKEFCVATYHMPCAFTQPKVMSLHTWQLGHRVLHHAAGRPCALLGDFNFQPDSDCYKLLAAGGIGAAEPSFVASLAKKDKKGNLCMNLSQPFTSSLKSVHGAEPDFTNNAVNKYDAFIGTLDYVWITGGLQAVDAVKLPHRSQVVDQPYPSDTEPSDHVLVWADVVFSGGKK